ncbi:MAG: hypothetical protein V1894_04435 [Chloroflexota bacterium]
MGKNIAIGMIILFLITASSFLVSSFSEIRNLKVSLNNTTTMLGEIASQLEQTEGKLTQSEAKLAQTETELTQTRKELSQARVDLLQAQRQFESERASLTKAAEDNRFFFYYIKAQQQQYSLDTLGLLMDYLYWLKEYQANVFDCSEMSACLEHSLENFGFHTLIAVGNSPDGSATGHAWLLVETEPNAYMPVEATQLSVVYWDNPYFNNYFRYDRTFETIQDALIYGPTEFDWWTY